MSNSKQNWVIGNWKMNGDLHSNAALLRAIVQTDAANLSVCVPYVYLAQVQTLLQNSRVQIGAQDVSQFEHGAYTGEVSATMLKEFGVTQVLVGHSERRQYFGDSDDVVAAKAQAAIKAGLTPIICVGESLHERESGQAQAVVLRQLKAVTDVIGAAGLAHSIVAYEPVWAIGTGLTATPAQAQEVHAWLRNVTAPNVSIVYGGSVKPANAAEIFAQNDVDGGLIGGAALNAADFIAIHAAL